jgi:clan AA aspartic protease (TIGR02281 family)
MRKKHLFPAALILLPLLMATACQQIGSPFAPSDDAAVEYRPEEAGTVDHALCLLGFAAVSVRKVRPGHHLVEATINGITGNFVLDTGANMTVISTSQAERFGLSRQAGSRLGFAAQRMGGISGNARQAAIDSLAIGTMTIRQRGVIIADLDQLLGALGEASGSEVAGVIGQDVLGEHRAIIDVARPMLYLMAQDRDPAPVPADQCRSNEAAVR